MALLLDSGHDVKQGRCIVNFWETKTITPMSATFLRISVALAASGVGESRILTG